MCSRNPPTPPPHPPMLWELTGNVVPTEGEKLSQMRLSNKQEARNQYSKLHLPWARLPIWCVRLLGRPWLRGPALRENGREVWGDDWIRDCWENRRIRVRISRIHVKARLA